MSDNLDIITTKHASLDSIVELAENPAYVYWMPGLHRIFLWGPPHGEFAHPLLVPTVLSRGGQINDSTINR